MTDFIPRPQEVTDILREIEECSTLPDLSACRDKHRARVKELAGSPDTKPFAHHIANLADYTENMIKAGRTGR
jgi:hypothetical protein